MRFVALDQTRGLAISAMILAHFGPGIYQRIGLDGVVLDILLLIGRLATPTFIALFGLTLAFAYVPKAGSDPEAMRNRLVKRSGVVFLAALAVTVPEFIATLSSDTHWGGSLFLDLLRDMNGVLTFYTLAIFSAGMIVYFLSAAPYAFSLMTGSALIFTGSMLGYDLWGPSGPGLLEWFRLILVSGKFSYMVNFGCALMLVAFGTLLRAQVKSGAGVNFLLISAGVTTLLCALAVGRIVGWRTLVDLHTNYGAPPQLWYLSAVIGTMFLVVAFFNSFRVPGISFVMEHTGRNPMSIYVAHTFVLPGVGLLRYLLPGLSGTLHVLIPMGLFLMYWTFVIQRSARS